MDTSAAQLAIGFALEGNWEKAIEINLQILSSDPANIDALNRLARAYTEVGKISDAKKIIEKALEIDPVNTIALKCREKLKNSSTSVPHFTCVTLGETFLEEPGKTKLVSLLNLGEVKNITSLDPGEEVKLFTHAHKVSVNSIDGKYIGIIPDDIAKRLRDLIKTGNKYQVLVKSVSADHVAVFIRETEHGEKAANVASFPTEKIDYVSFTPPELVHKDIPEVAIPEESSE